MTTYIRRWLAADLATTNATVAAASEVSGAAGGRRARARARPAMVVSVAVAVGIVLVAGSLGLMGPPQIWGVDAWSYWSYDPVHPYAGHVWGTRGAYQYAPAFAQLFMIGQLVPWPVFLAAWTVLLAAVAVGPVGRVGVLAVLLPPVTREVWYGNIHLLMAAAVVLGFRRPWTWAFVLLTKISPGVGLLWFVARRDWRSLGIALGATGAIVAVSFLLAPWMWREWLDVLVETSGDNAPSSTALPLGPLWLRVVVAGVIATIAGRAGLRWPLAIVLAISMPSVWFASLSVLVALPALVAMDRRDPLPSLWPLRPIARRPSTDAVLP